MSIAQRPSAAPVRVLIVDDSILIRSMLREVLHDHPQIAVVGEAGDPYEARELIKQLNPDVLTLDIEMPKMDGISFLRNLMRLRPLPVVMISTLTQAGAPATLEALEIGAVDFVAKAGAGTDANLLGRRREIAEKVIAAAEANLEWQKHRPAASAGRLSDPATGACNKRLDERFVCAIGASTGGTQAIKEVLMQLPEASPPLLITQHIPAAFSSSFAQRLDSACAIRVLEAEQGMTVEPGCAYVAPGDHHLRLKRTNRGYRCQLDQSEPINRHRPAVDVLFESVLAHAGNRAMAVLLTGMGVDGARAMRDMSEAGCVTVAQDQDSSVVWGMPGAAVAMGGATKVLPLQKIAKFILYQAYAEY